MTARRVLLPGMPIPVDDYAGLTAALPGDTVVLDTLVVPVTGTTAELQAGLQMPREPYELVGHSIGALAALEWAARHPRAISRLVLLDPSDPWGQPVPAALAGPPGRLLAGIVGLLSRQPRIARALGRWGRKSVLHMYGVTNDPLSQHRIDALFGTRPTLTTIVRQIAGVPVLVSRVRALLDGATAETFGQVEIIVLVARDGTVADSTASSRLAEQLGARVITVPGTHLFPMTHPASTGSAFTNQEP